jgi:HNH endonuclease
MTIVIPNLVLDESDRRRYRSKVAPPDDRGCRLWLRSVDHNGYGQFHLGRVPDTRTVKAHLVAWTIERGLFPVGLEPDHTCNVRNCQSVDHMEWVTHGENTRRIAERAVLCRAGLHRWDEQNPVMWSGYRECRPCRNAGKRRRYAETGVG